MAFVLFVGDPAQLPPVGEVESKTFSTNARAHLDTIVRQTAGNPVLDAAHMIRRSQGGAADWSWCKSANVKPAGIYLPRSSVDEWLKKAFTSPEFEENPDRFRYLAWRNQRVAEVNTKIRRWRYGDNIPTPFMPGERAMFRAPIIVNKTIEFNTNEEAKVISIARDTFVHRLDECESAPGWTAKLPSWRISLRSDEGKEVSVHMPADDLAYGRVVDRIKDEAAEARLRWKHLHDFKAAMAHLQSIYSLTVHCSQGSTFGTVFLDVPDIRRREEANLLETQQMLYTAITRPTESAILVGI